MAKEKNTNEEIEIIKSRINAWENCTLLEKLTRKCPKPATYEYFMLNTWIRGNYGRSENHSR